MLRRKVKQIRRHNDITRSKKIKQHKLKYTFSGYNKEENGGFRDKHVKDLRKRREKGCILSVFF